VSRQTSIIGTKVSRQEDDWPAILWTCCVQGEVLRVGSNQRRRQLNFQEQHHKNWWKAMVPSETVGCP
jgi:hypothetical protein